MKLALTSIAAALITGGLAGGELCKCLPSDSCWPSAADWETFNQTISGRLIRTVPPGSTLRAFLQLGLTTPVSRFTRTAPASAAILLPEREDAPLEYCHTYVVNATDATHVQEALRFAGQRNLRVVIKNTGHNGAGRNLGLGGLSIWTHNLKQTEFHGQFQALGCSGNTTWKGSKMAITIGAGIQDGEIFDFAKENNVLAVGGTNKDVGVVGWATGGGHGFMTGEYGMGADNILEAAIVTPTGKVITANACQNEDIFWAIRGGGGGTFGIIVNMTMKAYPIPQMTMLGLDVSSRNGTSSKAWWKFVAQFHGLLPALQKQGVKGYYTIGGPPSTTTIGLSSSFFLWDRANGTAEKLLAPLQQLISANNSTITGSITRVPVPSFYDLLSIVPVVESNARASTITAARLITERVVTENQDLLAEVLEEVGTRVFAPENGMPNLSMSGTMTISHEPVDNALNPVWRDSVVHLITQQSWDLSLPAANVSNMVTNMTYNTLNALRRLEPSSGTYLNEANVLEPGWQWSFFGPNYGRLRSIKEKYDPTGLLWCPQCVGSENWVQNEDGRLCKAFQPFY